MRLTTYILLLACTFNSLLADNLGDPDAQDYRKNAEQGDAIAQLNLGNCLYYGSHGCTRDYLEAAKWLKKAAEQGHRTALWRYGECYEDGNGVLKDTVEAYAYFNLAAISDNRARERRDRLEKEMTPSQVEAGQKRSRELQKEIDAKVPEKNKPWPWWKIAK